MENKLKRSALSKKSLTHLEWVVILWMITMSIVYALVVATQELAIIIGSIIKNLGDKDQALQVENFIILMHDFIFPTLEFLQGLTILLLFYKQK